MLMAGAPIFCMEQQPPPKIDIAQIISFQRGKKKLTYDGFMYLFKRATKTGQTWRCEQGWSENKCPSVAKVCVEVHDNEEKHIVKEVTTHNHAANADKVQISTLKHQCKEKAKNSASSTNANIISDVVSKVQDEKLLSIMPGKESLKRFVRDIKFDTKRRNLFRTMMMRNFLPLIRLTIYKFLHRLCKSVRKHSLSKTAAQEKTEL